MRGRRLIGERQQTRQLARALGDPPLEQARRLDLVADIAQHTEHVRAAPEQKRGAMHLDVEDAAVLADLARAGAELPSLGDGVDVLGEQAVIVRVDERRRVDPDQLVVLVAVHPRAGEQPREGDLLRRRRNLDRDLLDRLRRYRRRRTYPRRSGPARRDDHLQRDLHDRHDAQPHRRLRQGAPRATQLTDRHSAKRQGLRERLRSPCVATNPTRCRSSERARTHPPRAASQVASVLPAAQAGWLRSVLEVPAGQPMQVHQAIGSRKAGKRGGVSGRGLAAGTGSRRPFPQRPLCSRRPRRPPTGARPPCGGWIDLASIPLRAITHAITELGFAHLHPCQAHHGPAPGGHPRDHVKHSAGVLLVVGEPPGAVDGLGDVWYIATASRAIGPPSASRCPAHRARAGVGRRAAGRLSTTSAVQATQGCVGSSWP